MRDRRRFGRGSGTSDQHSDLSPIPGACRLATRHRPTFATYLAKKIIGTQKKAQP